MPRSAGRTRGSLEPAAGRPRRDRSRRALAPFAEHDPYVALVEAARPSDVRLTMVAGRVLYRDGTWATLDPDRVAAEARAEAHGLMRRVVAA